MKVGLVLMCALYGPVAAGDGRPSADLRVVISAHARPAKGPIEPYAAKAQFIDTVVTNISNKPRTIIAWTQAGWSWVSNSAQVSPGIEALKNAPQTIVLQPGQSYSSAVEVYVVGARPVTFRLGFFPTANAPISAQVPPASDSQITWSNALTIGR